MLLVVKVLSFVLMTNLAFGGGWTSGGGIGVMCQELGNSSVQILDLYEGLRVWNLKPLPNIQPVEKEIQDAVFRWLYAQSFPTIDFIKNPVYINAWKIQQTKKILENFNQSVFWIKNGQPIPPTNDATKPTLPNSCKFIQIASLKPTGQILVDYGFWSLLDNRNKAALILHETFYKFTLDLGELNSDTTRRFNAMIFSQSQPTRKFFDIPLDKVTYCSTKSGANQKYTDFYYYFSKHLNAYVANFNQIANSGLKPFRTIAKLGPLDLLSSSGSFSVFASSVSELEEQRYTFKLTRDLTGQKIYILDKNRNTSSSQIFTCKPEVVWPSK